MPEVLRGATDNNCILIPITSRSDSSEVLDRENITNNWLECFRVCQDDIFIGMDSDTILGAGIINRLMYNYQYYDIVIYHQMQKDGHDLFLFKKNILDAYPFRYADAKKCPVCDWLKKIEPYKNIFRKGEDIRQAKRT